MSARDQASRTGRISREYSTADVIFDWISFLILAAIPGVLAFTAVTLLITRTWAGVVAGAALLLVAGLVPLLLAYGYVFGIAAAAVGAAAAVARSRHAMTTPGWALATAAVLVLVAEPLVVSYVSQVRADESYSRCAADRALAVVESARTGGGGYPADMHEIALADGGYGVGRCYVSNGVNWLYRVSAHGSYTLGYWVDWRVTRHVCLHAARTQGWTCGFETWGPFKPGEVD